jgi:hypothetical protein
MPDISMCSNDFCPSKDSCYRFRAVPNIGRQSYAGFWPEAGEDQCEYFQRCMIGDMVMKDGVPVRLECKHVRREGEGCRLNNNCKFPNCESS